MREQGWICMRLFMASKRKLHRNLCNNSVFKGTCRSLFSAEQHTQVVATLRRGARKAVTLIQCLGEDN